LKMKENSQK